MRNKINKIHFIGIGGVGMSGIAELLHNLGYIVTGSDVLESQITVRLQSLGIKIFIGHNENNVKDTQVIVVSSAINANNPELLASIKQRKTIMPRAMMLAELMRFKYGIAIAGTHGKTTTTSLCAETLFQCGLDPTFIIGGKLAVSGSNAKLGNGEYLVAEADESDKSFLYLNPVIAVVTNIDLDHMDTYQHDENKLKQTFIDFLHRLPFYGQAILCNEDERIKQIIPLLQRKIITYGYDSTSDIYAKNINSINGKMHFTLCVKEDNIELPIILNLHGAHNVLNSLAVIAVSRACGIKIEQTIGSLANFHGVGRRCQHYPNIKHNLYEALLIDDYGHHPTEIKATTTALKDSYPDRRMIVIFQPHRYTRTRDLFDDFVKVLSVIDQVIVVEVYAAGEQPISTANSKALVKALKLHGQNNVNYASDIYDAKTVLLNMLADNDLVVTMGAGNVGTLPQLLITEN
jgi:UDP-N-acetylmuramate--alanine ligase